jgi:hypothetical protein
VFAPTCTPNKAETVDPLLGERLMEGAATDAYLWVRNGDGAVVEFRRSDGARRVLAHGGVVDMARSGGRLLGVRCVDAQRKIYQVFDLISGDAVSPGVALPTPSVVMPPMILLADGGLTLLIESVVSNDGRTLRTEPALYLSDGQNWRRQNLDGPIQRIRLPLTRLVSAASTNTGMIYAGYNRGEWGGEMLALDPSAGSISEVISDRDWDRSTLPASLGIDLPDRLPLGSVTGVVRDVGRPDCVLASKGLIHRGLVDGSIVRVCGTQAQTLFSGPIPSNLSGGAPMTWPFFGVASTREGWIAVTRGFVFRSSRGVVTRSKLPRTDGWRMEWKSADADLIILITDANRAQSLSGYTPLLVPVTR